MKKRVTGLGGFFFKTKKWDKDHLGLPVHDYGCTFWWKIQKVTTARPNSLLLKKTPTISVLVKNNS